ncbi:hypothetical protein V5P93_003975 [Actinokineospora auranticolor]|uniref:hypothetical protein n=1 Tax=Actinokineospora auranticolor TaxID=155976 RepID=UPI0011B0F144|nr:hypothetical protein [Actinokineospora auranticolor]
MAQDDLARPDTSWRERLGNFHGLCVVSMTMFDGRGADDNSATNSAACRRSGATTTGTGACT